MRAYREYGRRWQWKHPTPHDLFNTFEDVSGRELDWFWRTWFYETWTLDQAVGSVTPGAGGTSIVIRDRGLAPMPAVVTVTYEGGRAEMVVNLVSFGYKHGVPMDADLVFDVRCLPNPHFVDRLRGLTGRHRAVIAYMRRHPATQDFIDRLTSFLKFALPHYVQEGKSYLTVAIGCTGGQHRSVMLAEALKKSLGGVKGVRLRVKHRDS